MRGGRVKTRLFLVAVFVVLLLIAAAGWVVRPFAAMARWGVRFVGLDRDGALAPGGDRRQLRWRAGG